MARSFDNIPVSDRATRTVNRLLAIAAQLKANAPKDKEPVALSIGDPTLDGNFIPPHELTEAMIRNALSNTACGYLPADGFPPLRESIVKFWNTYFSGDRTADLRVENTFVASGCAEVIECCIAGICNPGDNILLPAPLFPEYITCCDSNGIDRRHYKCNPSTKWEIDIEQLRSLVDDKTKALFLNNPSNPCGSNFSREHLQEIINFAEEMKLPIISDEIYAGMVFKDQKFVSVAAFDTPVPRFVIGGVSKNMIVPGWRLGWCIGIDRDNQCADLLSGPRLMTNRFRQSNTLVQKSTAEALDRVSNDYFEEMVDRLESGAMYMYNLFKECDGLKPIQPQGTMFMMVGLDFSMLREDIADGMTFAKKLAEEENVQVLPGEAFLMPGYVRVTVSRPHETLEIAVTRIDEFCKRHSRRTVKKD